MGTKDAALQTMEFRLSYADCDPAGIVYYAAYYPWMERTYNEWALTGGFPTNKMRELWGATHISRASNCEYFTPGVLFDQIRCEMRLDKVGTTSSTMVFDMVHAERGDVIARGHIVFVFIDDDMQPTPVPDGFHDAVRRYRGMA